MCRVAEAVCRVSTLAASAAHAAPVGAAAGSAAAAAAGARHHGELQQLGQRPPRAQRSNAPAAARSEVKEDCPCRRPNAVDTDCPEMKAPVRTDAQP